MSSHSLVKDRAEARPEVLVVDDQDAILKLFARFLEPEGYRVRSASTAEEALAEMRASEPDVLVADIHLEDQDGVTLVERALALWPELRAILVTGMPSVETAARAVRAGAHDYVCKPLARQDLVAAVFRAARARQLLRENTRLRSENRYLRASLEAERPLLEGGPGLRSVLEAIERVAPQDASVLIQGETGTGKELVARAIHAKSPRGAVPMVCVNCAAISESLAESELFGHERGAFTGADSRRIGRFELAHGGTLFLDEVGDLPLGLQAKMLRVIQEGELERVGGTERIEVDFRLIAATHRDLEAAVRAGRFRADLYYRISVFPITVPPLRERREDIPELARSLLERIARETGGSLPAIPPELMRRLQQYDWPGNVRELENTLRRAVLNSSGEVLSLRESAPAEDPGRPLTLREAERRHILAMLERTKGVIEGPRGAARLLGLAPSTLRSKIRRLSIPRRSPAERAGGAAPPLGAARSPESP